jgi:hypothetical protein
MPLSLLADVHPHPPYGIRSTWLSGFYPDGYIGLLASKIFVSIGVTVFSLK